jgi:site-specific DNA-methyltransferase (adenine-specific)
LKTSGGNYYKLPPSRGWLVWWKRDSVPSAADCELAWTSFDMNTRLIDCTIASTNAERVGHPTQKPERVMLWSLGFAESAETVIDPFMGSGTTLVAAKRLGLKAVGIEINESYCEIAAKRLAQGALPMAG